MTIKATTEDGYRLELVAEDIWNVRANRNSRGASVILFKDGDHVIVMESPRELQRQGAPIN